MRRFICLIHRYVGLIMAIFLLIAGLTGAILAWYHELDTAINPQWTRVQPPSPDAQPLSYFVLHEQVQARYPKAWVNYINLNNRLGEAVVFSLAIN
ncbi:MAG: PepSY domain-containing protein [Nitrosomonas sp.]|nr:PepSY domain-containing protein [Nitrosomonas sp.]